MTNIPIYQVDAFASAPFTGNPAAVCPLEEWLEDDLMQSIAMENNLAETAFFIPRAEGGFHLRWFTPTTEVDLCGHATLASAHVLFEQLSYEGPKVEFHTNTGLLIVEKKDDEGVYTMDFPSDVPFKTELKKTEKESLFNGIDQEPQAIYRGVSDILVVLEDQAEVEGVIPNFSLLERIDARGIIITAKGKEVDFVSRFFAPQSGVDEDPVTGSTHTTLTPFWAKELGKSTLQAKQLSLRGGSMECTLQGDRVCLTGRAITVLKGEFILS